MAKDKACYYCRFHDVYWTGTRFDGCSCRAFHEGEQLSRYHKCEGSASYDASRQSGRDCPRFVYYPPDEWDHR